MQKKKKKKKNYVHERPKGFRKGLRKEELTRKKEKKKKKEPKVTFSVRESEAEDPSICDKTISAA